MAFFKRANHKSDEANGAPLRNTMPSTAAQPSIDPVGEGAEVVGLGKEEQANRIQLARTRTEDIVYPTGLKLAALMISTFVSMFLVALVRCAKAPSASRSTWT